MATVRQPKDPKHNLSDSAQNLHRKRAGSETGKGLGGAPGLEFSNPCELCQRRLPRLTSHIIPSFVIEWMKQSGGAGYLRRPVDPNKREQDGPKQEMLCADCEQKFSVHEKWFAETVFHPYLRDRQLNLSYDFRLYYVLASMLWRSGIACRKDRQSPQTEWSLFHAKNVARHLEIWRTFLNGENSADLPSIHCFLTDIGTTDGVQPVVNFSRYMAHTFDITIADDGEAAVIYSKFSRFILFAPVTPVDENLLVGTRVFPDGGTLRTPQALREPHIGQFIVMRAKLTHELFQSRISPRQKAVIDAAARKNIEKLRNSDLGAILEADFTATIKPQLNRPTRFGRNKLCPCGSGIKFKRCHGR